MSGDNENYSIGTTIDPETVKEAIYEATLAFFREQTNDPTWGMMVKKAIEDAAYQAVKDANAGK